MKKLILLLSYLVILSACNDKKMANGIKDINNSDLKELTTAEMIANRNGFKNWDSISEMRFTFNVERGESHFERSWIWKPMIKEITLITMNDTLKYNQMNLDSISSRADASFINDKYWLLAPFNLVWDEGKTITESKNVIAPISKDTLNQITIVYGSEGGYTPGDAYDFYFDDDYKIREWVFRKGNDSIPSVTTTWEDYEIFSGIEIAKMHKDDTGNFKLFFTNISIK